MARKTLGEQVDELVIGQAMVQERLDVASKAIAKLQTTLDQGDFNSRCVLLAARLDRLQEDFKDLQRQIEESSRRLWMIMPPLIAALVSAGLMAMVNYLTRR